jgi:hypothetical protein
MGGRGGLDFEKGRLLGWVNMGGGGGEDGGSVAKLIHQINNDCPTVTDRTKENRREAKEMSSFTWDFKGVQFVYSRLIINNCSVHSHPTPLSSFPQLIYTNRLFLKCRGSFYFD